MGWGGFRSLRDATRFMSRSVNEVLRNAKRHIQSTKRAVGKRSMTLGWDGEVSRRKQSRSEVHHIQSPLENKKIPFNQSSMF